MADTPAASAAAAASSVKMPLAIHGIPTRQPASASWSHDHAGFSALMGTPNISPTLGEPSPGALPDQMRRSGRNPPILLRARNPVCGQSTVTHSAS